MSDLANWYASGSAGGLTAVATCMRCTPEEAVRLAMRHAVSRYSVSDWSAWTFTVEEFGFGRQRMLRYKVDRNGEPTRAS